MYQALDFNHLNVQGQIAWIYDIIQNFYLIKEKPLYNYTGIDLLVQKLSNRRNNENKTYKLRPNQGGTQMFNQSMNVEYAKLIVIEIIRM